VDQQHAQLTLDDGQDDNKDGNVHEASIRGGRPGEM
jgi:hypothetical protein